MITEFNDERGESIMFNPNTAFSRKGEIKAKNALEKLGWACYDIHDIPTTYKGDIDLVATKGETARLIEIKYDDVMCRTGNMFIEVVKNKLLNEKGWIYYTVSEYIMYGDANKDIFYSFRTMDMLEYLEKHKDEYGYGEKREGRKVSVGALVSPYDFE